MSRRTPPLAGVPLRTDRIAADGDGTDATSPLLPTSPPPRGANWVPPVVGGICMLAVFLILLVGAVLILDIYILKRVDRRLPVHSTCDEPNDVASCGAVEALTDDAINATCGCVADAEIDLKTFIASQVSTLATLETNNYNSLFGLFAFITNAFNSLQVFITNLFAQYFGMGCFLITSLPFTLPTDNTRYCLASNLALNSAVFGITINGRRNVVLDYSGYVINVNFDGALVVFVNSSTDVQILRSRHIAPVQQLGANSRGFNVQGFSQRVIIDRPYCENLRLCFIGFNSDGEVIDPQVWQHFPGNGTIRGVIGIEWVDGALYLERGYFRNDAQAQTLISDPINIAVYSLRNPTDIGTSNIRIQGPTRIVGYNYGMDIHRGSTGQINKVAVEMGPLGGFGSCMQFGSSGPYDGLQVSELSCDMNTTQPAADGFLFWNFRSFSARDVTSRVHSLPGVGGYYQGAAITIGIALVPGAPLNAVFAQKAGKFDRLTAYVDQNDTICVRTYSGFHASNGMSVDISGVVTTGGLAGVVFANQSHNIRLSDVQVMGAAFGIAAVNYTHALSVRDATIMRVCTGIYSDNTTRGLRVSGNTEMFEVNVPLAVEGINNDIGSIALVDAANADPNCAFADPSLLRYNPYANNNAGGYTVNARAPNNAAALLDAPISGDELDGAAMLTRNGWAPKGASPQQVVRLMRESLRRRFGERRQSDLPVAA